MRLAAALLLSAAVLGACTREEREPAPPAGAPEPPAILAGVDLAKPVRALGTEPFWSADLSGSAMSWNNADGATARADQPDPVVQGTMATFAAETADGQPFEVVLIATECSDGMSDRLYPLVAQVTVGEQKLNGCAASRDALVAAPESGPVEAPAAPAAPQPPA